MLERKWLVLKLGPKMIHQLAGGEIGNRLLKIDSDDEERWKTSATPKPPLEKVAIRFRGIALAASPHRIVSAVRPASVGGHDMVDGKVPRVSAIDTFLGQCHAYPLVAHQRPWRHRGLGQASIQPRSNHKMFPRIGRIFVVDCHFRHRQIRVTPEKALGNGGFQRTWHGRGPTMYPTAWCGLALEGLEALAALTWVQNIR